MSNIPSGIIKNRPYLLPPLPPNRFYVEPPDAISANDVLFIEGNGLANIFWTIYDRWGNELFESYDQALGWDGTKNGSPLETGTYVYYLKATCVKTNQEVYLKGNVSITK